MHLNMDNLYNTPVQFPLAVAVLRDCLQDYDINKAKLVSHPISPHELFLRIRTFLLPTEHFVIFLYSLLHIWIPIFHREQWVVYCINLIHSRIDIFDTCCDRYESIVEWHKPIKEKIPLIFNALCEVTDWKKLKMPNLNHFQNPFPTLLYSRPRHRRCFLCLEEH
jgi:hypothetical protein